MLHESPVSPPRVPAPATSHIPKTCNSCCAQRSPPPLPRYGPLPFTLIECRSHPSGRTSRGWRCVPHACIARGARRAQPRTSPMATPVEVPTLGESVTQAILVKWHKKDGEPVNIDEPLCELETDKANVDVPSKATGIVRRLKEEGDTVQVGEAIARIEDSGAAGTKAST